MRTSLWLDCLQKVFSVYSIPDFLCRLFRQHVFFHSKNLFIWGWGHIRIWRLRGAFTLCNLTRPKRGEQPPALQFHSPNPFCFSPGCRLEVEVSSEWQAEGCGFLSHCTWWTCLPAFLSPALPLLCGVGARRSQRRVRFSQQEPKNLPSERL